MRTASVPGEAEVLAELREDEVGGACGDVREGRLGAAPAIEDPVAGEASGANRDLGLPQVEAAAEGVAPGVEEDREPLALVGRDGEGERKRHDAEPVASSPPSARHGVPAATAIESHASPSIERRPGVRLHDDEAGPRGPRGRSREREQRASGGRSAKQRGQRHHERELGHLGGLERGRAQFDPAPRAVGSDADREDRDEQRDTAEVCDRRESPQQAVVEGGAGQQDEQAERCEQQLAEPRTALEGERCPRRGASGGDGDGSEREQPERAEREPRVEAGEAPRISGRPRSRGRRRLGSRPRGRRARSGPRAARPRRRIICKKCRLFSSSSIAPSSSVSTNAIIEVKGVRSSCEMFEKNSWRTFSRCSICVMS